MNRLTVLMLTMVVVVCGFGPGLAEIGTQQNLFFLHHSTGRNMLNEGHVRDWIADYNQASGTNFVLWDHDYNYREDYHCWGLKNPSGVETEYGYNVPDNNTDPIGLHQLFTTANAARDSIINNHEVVAFKSCYPNSAIHSDAQLAQYKTWYLEMRDFFDQHPNTTFVIMSPPPLRLQYTNPVEADRARAFANWLGSDEYLGGHGNLVFFDFFDLLAHPDDGSGARNLLRSEYCRSNAGDCHPNPLANETVGPLFAQFLTGAARVPSDQPTSDELKALFR